MDTRICKHCGKPFECDWSARDILCSDECRRLRRLELGRKYHRERKYTRKPNKERERRILARVVATETYNQSSLVSLCDTKFAEACNRVLRGDAVYVGSR